MNTEPTDSEPSDSPEDLAILRNDAALLIAEIQELEVFTKAELDARYQVEIGPSELVQLEIQYQLTLARRELGLAQRCQNLWRIDWPEVKKQAAAELIDWHAKIAAKKAQIQEANIFLKTQLPQSDRDTIKETYRELVRSLHPGLFTEQNADQRQLWDQATAAYQAADLNTLQGINRTLLGSPTPATPPAPQRAAQIADLREQTRNLQAVLESLRNSPMFAMRVPLSNPHWIRTRCKDIEYFCRALRNDLKDLKLATGFVAITFPPWPVDDNAKSPTFDDRPPLQA